jgi:hypothetical protein
MLAVNDILWGLLWTFLIGCFALMFTALVVWMMDD